LCVRARNTICFRSKEREAPAAAAASAKENLAFGKIKRTTPYSAPALSILNLF
jgi:hypothetical protein